MAAAAAVLLVAPASASKPLAPRVLPILFHSLAAAAGRLPVLHNSPCSAHALQQKQGPNGQLNADTAVATTCHTPGSLIMHHCSVQAVPKHGAWRCKLYLSRR